MLFHVPLTLIVTDWMAEKLHQRRLEGSVGKECNLSIAKAQAWGLTEIQLS